MMFSGNCRSSVVAVFCFLTGLDLASYFMSLFRQEEINIYEILNVN